MYRVRMKPTKAPHSPGVRGGTALYCSVDMNVSGVFSNLGIGVAPVSVSRLLVLGL